MAEERNRSNQHCPKGRGGGCVGENEKGEIERKARSLEREREVAERRDSRERVCEGRR